MGETVDKVLSSGAEADFDTIRAAVREVMKEDGLSQTAVARAAGIDDGRMSGFMTGRYAGHMAPIAVILRNFLQTRQSKATVRAAVPAPTSFVETETSRLFHDLFARAHHTPSMVCITGNPGVGKTEAARAYRRSNANVWLMTATQSIAGVYAMLENVCDLLGVVENSPSRRARAIAARLRNTGSLLIIDEAQLMSLDAVDELRAFHDNPDVRLGIALVGSSETWLRMSNGGKRSRYAQLRRRFETHFFRKAPLADDVNALLDAEGIADAEVRKLLRTEAARVGALGEMKFVLRDARYVAAGAFRTEVTAEDVKLASKQRQAEAAA